MTDRVFDTPAALDDAKLRSKCYEFFLSFSFEDREETKKDLRLALEEALRKTWNSSGDDGHKFLAYRQVRRWEKVLDSDFALDFCFDETVGCDYGESIFTPKCVSFPSACDTSSILTISQLKSYLLCHDHRLQFAYRPAYVGSALCVKLALTSGWGQKEGSLCDWSARARLKQIRIKLRRELSKLLRRVSALSERLQRCGSCVANGYRRRPTYKRRTPNHSSGSDGDDDLGAPSRRCVRHHPHSRTRGIKCHRKGFHSTSCSVSWRKRAGVY